MLTRRLLDHAHPWREPGDAAEGALGGCYVHTFRACLEAVQLVSEAVGTAGIYRRCPLDRHLRDLITINRHVLAQVRTLEVVGGMWFGAEPPLPLL